jgi:hypothetical protein
MGITQVSHTFLSGYQIIWRAMPEQTYLLYSCRGSHKYPQNIFLEVSRSHTIRHTSGRIPTNEWLVRRLGHYQHNAQQTQEANIHALSGIQTRDPSNQAMQTCALNFTAICICLTRFLLQSFNIMKIRSTGHAAGTREIWSAPKI